MPRNLDLSALRSFVTVADVGGVTRAAGYLNLTQSAVSMQIKRLEDALGMTLFVITLALNIFALWIVRKYREQYE